MRRERPSPAVVSSSQVGPVRVAGYLLGALLAGPVATPAFAHHPGHDLDEVMGSKEQFFQAVDQPAPPFTLQDADGRRVSMEDLRGKVVVAHFIYAGCPDICPLHADLIAEVQEMVNRTPMQDMAQFVTITTDPANDTPEVLKDYGPARGLDSRNWTFLTTTSDQPEDATRRLALAYGHKFARTDDGYQVHGVVTHVVGRDGRWRANFHGLRFEPVNLVLYLNGLTHEDRAPHPPAEAGWWDRLKGLVR
jgi:protein SCO1